MKIFEFLSQSPKKIGQDFRLAGLNTYQEIPTTKKKLCKLLSLDNDESIEGYHVINRSGITEMQFNFYMPFKGIDDILFECEYYFNQNCEGHYSCLGGMHHATLIYEDGNDSIYIRTEEYVGFILDGYGNRHAQYDDNVTLKQYIEMLLDKVNKKLNN